MWTFIVLVLVVSGAFALWDAPDRARRHAAERQSVLDALAVLRPTGTTAGVARQIARRTGLRPSDRVIQGQLAALEEDGIVVSAGPGSTTQAERRFTLRDAVPAGTRGDPAENTGTLTVYHDGGCPLCAAEIGQYKRALGAHALRFADVSDPDVAPADDLTREDALARFHVRDGSGTVLSGAEAFAALWQALPHWRWLGRIVGSRPVLPVAELAYRAFLPLRPRLAAALVALGILKPAPRDP